MASVMRYEQLIRSKWMQENVLTVKVRCLNGYKLIDVRTLLKNDGLLNSLAPATFAEYNNTQYIKVDSPKGHKVRGAAVWDLHLSSKATAKAER